MTIRFFGIKGNKLGNGNKSGKKIGFSVRLANDRCCHLRFWYIWALL
jgi:hypothetical protein